jgi:hypothetical protein
MSSFTQPCTCPQQDWEYLNCGCIQCGRCGEIVHWCNSNHCELEDYETAYTDEDVEDFDVDVD